MDIDSHVDSGFQLKYGSYLPIRFHTLDDSYHIHGVQLTDDSYNAFGFQIIDDSYIVDGFQKFRDSYA